jgi:hypothetical protein
VEAQRPAGTWQAELPAVRHLLRLLGGAAGHARVLVGELQVDVERMRHNASGTPVGPALLESAQRLVEQALAAHRAVDG